MTTELSNWGVFGDGDELGTLNYLDANAVRRGLAAATRGETYTLNLPADLPRGRAAGRPELTKTAHLRNASVQGIVVNDDHVVLATQGSTQWDALIHFGVQHDGEAGVFYNGVGTDAVDDAGFAHRNGIDAIARRGITGRGVLLDVARIVTGTDGGTLAVDHVITVDETRACIDHQGVTIEPGDIVCFRTGWTDAYLAGDDAARAVMMGDPADPTSLQCPGISADHAPLAHEQRWAAVTADNIAVEAVPFQPDATHSAHARMLRDLGIVFGELFVFGDLAAACAGDGDWTFLFVAVPLWIPGGMGSPGNAIAIR
jgi:kynurenine formamidase